MDLYWFKNLAVMGYPFLVIKVKMTNIIWVSIILSNGKLLANTQQMHDTYTICSFLLC